LNAVGIVVAIWNIVTGVLEQQIVLPSSANPEYRNHEIAIQRAAIHYAIASL